MIIGEIGLWCVFDFFVDEIVCGNLGNIVYVLLLIFL